MSDELLKAARRIAEKLLVQSTVCGDASLSWGRGAGRSRQPVADSGPFNGRCGEALLFAALHRATGQIRWRDAALRTIRTLLEGLPRPAYRARLAEDVVDGLGGLGGILYTLVRIASLLGREEIWRAAEPLVEVVTPRLIDRDTRCDVIWGSAGLLHALLVLTEAGSTRACEPAQLCVQHLLRHRLADPRTGLHGWSGLRAVPTTGFAHGSSGVAHALLRWSVQAGDSDAVEAAYEAFAFERSLYEPDRRNWAESRLEVDSEIQMWSWCHGAPGIGLARLAALEQLRQQDEATVAADLKAAIEASIMARVPGVDTICCGYFGRIDLLLEAGLCLGNPALIEHARRIAHQRLARADSQGWLLTSADEDAEPHLAPGFWQGLGGTAYTLIRLTDPEAYPCVLAML